MTIRVEDAEGRYVDQGLASWVIDFVRAISSDYALEVERIDRIILLDRREEYGVVIKRLYGMDVGEVRSEAGQMLPYITESGERRLAIVCDKRDARMAEKQDDRIAEEHFRYLMHHELGHADEHEKRGESAWDRLAPKHGVAAEAWSDYYSSRKAYPSTTRRAADMLFGQYQSMMAALRSAASEEDEDGKSEAYFLWGPTLVAAARILGYKDETEDGSKLPLEGITEEYVVSLQGAYKRFPRTIEDDLQEIEMAMLDFGRDHGIFISK